MLYKQQTLSKIWNDLLIKYIQRPCLYEKSIVLYQHFSNMPRELMNKSLKRKSVKKSNSEINWLHINYLFCSFCFDFLLITLRIYRSLNFSYEKIEVENPTMMLPFVAKTVWSLWIIKWNIKIIIFSGISCFTSSKEL